jgi:ABC-2 type transport system ATP-binding protein
VQKSPPPPAAAGSLHPRTTPGVAVDAHELARSFGAVHAVAGVSLQIRTGESVALLGPNGAGKTTLISLLLGLLAPDAGRLAILGDRPRAAIAAGRVGAMLQDGGLMPGVRVGELLQLVRSLYPDPLSLEEAADLAQVGDFIGQRVDRLSGGQTQRVRVALALIGNPELLVLDEPTAAMDVEARRRFWQGMQAQTARGTTILFSTHNLEEADGHSERVVVLGGGRVLADGTPAAIKGRVGLRILRARLSRAEHAEALRGAGSVSSLTLHGDRVEVLSPDTDSVLRHLLAIDRHARDIEVSGLGLEDAFLALTGSLPTPAGGAERAA